MLLNVKFLGIKFAKPCHSCSLNSNMKILNAKMYKEQHLTYNYLRYKYIILVVIKIQAFQLIYGVVGGGVWQSKPVVRVNFIADIQLSLQQLD